MGLGGRGWTREGEEQRGSDCVRGLHRRERREEVAATESRERKGDERKTEREKERERDSRKRGGRGKAKDTSASA